MVGPAFMAWLAAKGWIVAPAITPAIKATATAKICSAPLAKAGAAKLGATKLGGASVVPGSTDPSMGGALDVTQTLEAGAAMTESVAHLIQVVSDNIVPIIAGATGGGAIGAGVAGRHKKTLETKLETHEERIRRQEATAEAHTSTLARHGEQVAAARAEAGLIADQRQAASLRDELDAANQQIIELKEQLAAAGETRVEIVIPDRLETIKGIGPKYAARLQSAGVYRYSDLVARTPEELMKIVVVDDDGVEPNIQDWLEQAQALIVGT